MCRRDQLRLRRFTYPSVLAGFGQPVRLRLEMPFCRRAFDVTATVISATASSTALDLDPIPGELELFLDQLERDEVAGPQRGPMFADDEDSSVSIEIRIETSDDLEFTDDEDSDYWANLLVADSADLTGNLDAAGLKAIRDMCTEGGPTGALSLHGADHQTVCFIQAGEPLVCQSEPADEGANLDLALVMSPDIEIEVFDQAIDRQIETGGSLASVLLEMRALTADQLLDVARKDAGEALDALTVDPTVSYAFWATEIPTASDGQTVDVAALLLAAGILFAGE